MYEDLLRQVPLFQDLSHRELTLLGDACRARDYAAGDTLVRTGNRSGMGLFLVTSGSVRIVQYQENVELEREIEEFGAGTILGEKTLLEEAPRMITVTAAEPTRAVVLPIWDFRETLRDYPDLAIHLLAILSQQLRAQQGPPGAEGHNDVCSEGR